MATLRIVLVSLFLSASLLPLAHGQAPTDEPADASAAVAETSTSDTGAGDYADAAPFADDPIYNIGHYIVGPYEFFAEERTKEQQANDDGRSRIFVMPNVVLLPWETNVYSEGLSVVKLDAIKTQSTRLAMPQTEPSKRSTAAVSSAPKVTPVGHSRRVSSGGSVIVYPTPAPPKPPAAPPTYTARVVFKLTTDEVSPDAKKLILAQLWNTDYGDQVARIAGDSALYWSHAQNSQLSEVTTMSLPRPPIGVVDYRFEVTAPSSVVVTIHCNGKERGRSSFPSGATISTLSTVGVDCVDLDAVTARLMYQGHFSVTADMRVPLSRMQFAMAKYDMRNFNRILARQFARRHTEVTEEDHGFLFWSNVERSVSTFITAESQFSGSTEMQQSYYLSQRDLDDPSIREAAMRFIFPTSPATTEDIRRIMNEHVQAAAAADQQQQTEAAEAHRQYARYLGQLLVGNRDNSAADQALEALAKLIESVGGEEGAAAASGNPYVALATFLVKGIVWSDSKSSDHFEMSTLRTADWSATESRQFNAVIANQITASYSVTQSDFPQLRTYLTKRELMPTATPYQIIEAIQSDLQQKAAQPEPETPQTDATPGPPSLRQEDGL